jgi:hypothetical protein
MKTDPVFGVTRPRQVFKVVDFPQAFPAKEGSELTGIHVHVDVLQDVDLAVVSIDIA